jgi:hypothetical protein
MRIFIKEELKLQAVSVAFAAAEAVVLDWMVFADVL